MSVKCPKCHADNPDTQSYCGDCGTQLIPLSVTKTLKVSAALSPGKTIAGKYKILKEIGRGGMGVVYKAQDVRLDRTVALKFLSSELTRDEEAKRRFIHEAKAAASLDHSNICTVHEVDEADDQTFIAMSYLEGKSLKEKLKSGPLEINEVLDIAAQVAEGLREAHAKGIVHRDIKPANIMLTEKGQAKIMDFGLAKLSWGVDLTKTSTVMGTVAYMSPEQAKGEAVDHRTDIWSFGVVLYEMLTGALPFKGEHEQSLLYAIMNKEPLPLMKVSPGIPREVENIIHTALAKNITERYQSFEDILEDLQAVTQGLKPIKAKRRAKRTRILGLKKIHFYAGLTALVVIAAAAILLFLPGRGEVLDSIAILPLVNDSGDPTQDYFANSLTTLLISELYKVAALKVAPRESVMPYKNSTKSMKEKADELNVKALLEASVLRSGDRVRLTANLIDPHNNRILWSETLEKEYSEILILQSDLCQAIVSGIRVAVTHAEKERLVTERKVVRQAYDLFLKGLDYLITHRQPECLWVSLDLFQKAIDIDPTLAIAHAWKAQVLIQLGINGYVDEKEVYPKAKEAVLEALKIDPGLSTAHRVLGSIKLSMDWDFLGAEMETRRAVELDPGDPIAHTIYVETLLINGKSDEAINYLNRWISSSEIDITYVGNNVQYCFRYLLAGYFKEALEVQQKIMKSNTNNSRWDLTFMLAIAYAMNDLNSEALTEMEKIKDHPTVKERVFMQVAYACILGRCGHRKEALERLEYIRASLIKKNIEPSFHTACVFADLGDKDKAFLYLNQAYEKHSTFMMLLISDWWLRSLHGDPRFEDLRKKVGFPEVQLPAEK